VLVIPLVLLPHSLTVATRTDTSRTFRSHPAEYVGQMQ
jgi:hypothetical protein